MIPLLRVCTIAAVLLALVLEFFAFGGDYSRAERLEYEDDEYFYYVKAVPKNDREQYGRKSTAYQHKKAKYKSEEHK